MISQPGRGSDTGLTMSRPEEYDETHSIPTPWHVVPMGDYAVPTDLSVSAIKKRWRALDRLLRDPDSEANVARTESELRALPHVRLANLVPPIDWTPASQALAYAVDEAHAKACMAGSHTTGSAASAGGESPVQFFIGQPYCNHAAILTDWADRHYARTLTPPSVGQILDGNTRWLDTLRKDEGHPWVLPTLERCFLRHSKGLDLLRYFLERALAGALGPGVIGCQSWAFAFVQRIWPLPATPVLTLQAFDGLALADYFVRTHHSLDSGRRIRFLSARSGEPLVPEAKPDFSPKDADPHLDRKQALPELRQLAAHCRGNPGLAWHYWRKQLRAEPEHELQELSDSEKGTNERHDGSGHASEDVVWVTPDLETCSLPAETGEDVAFLLHALLLHGGLPAEVLALLLPVPRGRVISQLQRLQALGVLIFESECWQVAPLAYPTVREFLLARTYLTDAF